MEAVDNVKMPYDTSSLQLQLEAPATATATPVRKTFLVSSISTGIQFGWALQLSLLTPYVQLLGIPHKWASIIWLCGPISGMVVTPLVGYHSDRCTSRFGRRRPFIASGAALVTVSVCLIGFAADLGHRFGDAADTVPKPRAIVIFVIGFWFLDVANNMLQAPLRALLADLSGGDQRKTSTANALYSFFIAVGNVLGYSAGAYTRLYRIFPFTRTSACDVYCANLKSCFFISVALLLSLTTLALSLVRETPLSGGESAPETEKVPFVGELAAAFRGLQRPMLILMVVTCLNWIAWFPFFLFDTDWMGKEVFGGKVGEGAMYAQGVRVGSLGLMLNSVVIGVSSLAIGFVAKKIGGVKRLWGIVNFLLAICLGLTVLVTKLAESTRRYGGYGEPLPPPLGVKVGALLLFSVLGIPLAVTYSVPFALASIFSNATGAGQGLSLGVLNLAIVIPQMVVSVAAGPWDDLFGGGNLPGFVVGAIAAAASGLLSLTMLPSPPPLKLSTSAAAAAATFH